MKKILVIIRTFPKDDWIAYNCYNSFNSVMNCDVVFFAERGEYKWITQTVCEIIYRESCSNFGGQHGLYVLINGLKKYNVDPYDKIILSDSDIVMLKNPLDVEVDFGGIMDKNNPKHYSGQLLIFSRSVWTLVMNNGNYDELIKYFVDSKTIDVADDTCISFVAWQTAATLHDYDGEGYWLHEKLYHLEPLVK